MKFFWKVFISVFITILVVGSFLLIMSYRFMNHWTTTEYISRYSAFSTVLGNTLRNLDINTENFMRNAAQIVAQTEETEGFLSTQKLKTLRDDLKVTHIFLINNKGVYIRSTNEDPQLIPNIFSFCRKYPQLFTGEMAYDVTPIIHPKPEVKPFKFFILPSKNRKSLIEIGLRVDFVAQTLIEALGADANLISFSLYSPIGEVLGRFSAKGVEFNNNQVVLPHQLPQLIEQKDSFRNYIKLSSSHPVCCQCQTSGITRNGEHYYVLEAEFSKKGLAPVKAAMQKTFILFTLLTVLVAFLLSHYISRKLVAPIEWAAQKLKLIKAGSAKRIHLKGGDEISFLTNQFDCLLDQLEESQVKIVESEKLKTKVQFAREVAHNMRAPALAIELVLPLFKDVSEKARKIIYDSARDIRHLAERLLHQANSEDQNYFPLNPSLEAIPIKGFLEDFVQKKNLEHSENTPNLIWLKASESLSNVIIYAHKTDLSAVISNLINNAQEAYVNKPGVVQINCELNNNLCLVSVKDSGCGIPQEILQKIGHEEITYGKTNGQGIGLWHACNTLKKWGGQVKMESLVGKGTTVILEFPFIRTKHENSQQSAQLN